MNIETARALVEDIDAGAYELSEALEWALDELESQGEAVSVCHPPTSRSAEVMQAYNEGAVISIGDILRLAAEVDELRAERDLWRWRFERVVARLEPPATPVNAAQVDIGADWELQIIAKLHSAALEIMAARPKENE